MNLLREPFVIDENPVALRKRTAREHVRRPPTRGRGQNILHNDSPNFFERSRLSLCDPTFGIAAHEIHGSKITRRRTAQYVAHRLNVAAKMTKHRFDAT